MSDTDPNSAPNKQVGPYVRLDVDSEGSPYRAMDDVVLYDIFFDTATQLGGCLVAEWRAAEDAGDLDAAEALRVRHHAVRDEREAIHPLDRAAQINQILAWQRERKVLAIKREG